MFKDNPMRKPSLILSIGFIAAALAGCSTPPERRDAFEGLGGSQASLLGGLTVMVVSSENTRQARTYLSNLMGTGVPEQTDRLFEGIETVFQRNFKAVVKLDSLEDAKSGHGDLVAVLDVYARSLEGLSAKHRVEVEAIFQTPDGNMIDRVKAQHELFGWSHFTAAGSIGELADEVPKKFEAALQSGAGLSGFAQSHFQPTKSVASSAPTAHPAPTRMVFSDIDRPSYRAAENPADFAIVVGIEDYASLPRADFAERDAEAVRKHLLALGYPQRNIIFLTGHLASRTSIEKYVESWLPLHITADSKVFLYFSGHGAPDLKTGEAYLIPWDGDPSFLENTGYPVKRLYERMANLKAKEVLVAMDACFSGAGGRSVLPKGARPLVMKIATAAVPQNLTVFAAATGEQITSTLEDQGHGTFTYYFLKGLSGGAKDASGRVMTQALYDYLKPKVQDAARLQNRDQEPVLHTQGDHELVRF